MSHPPRSLALLLAALLLAACGVPDRSPLSAQASPAPAEGATPALTLPARETVVATAPLSYPAPAPLPAALPYPPPARNQSSTQTGPQAAYPGPPPRPTPTYAPPTIDLGAPLAVATGAVQISRDSRYAVYVADQDGDQQYDLFSARLDGPAPARLYGPILLPPATPGHPLALLVTPDSGTVVFQVPGDGIYRVPIEGGQAVRIGPTADELRLSPDGAWVVSHQSGIGVFSQPLAGGAPTQLSRMLPMSSLYDVTFDSQHVVFEQGTLADGIELYSAPISGGAPTCLSCEPGVVHHVPMFRLTPDGSAAVYLYQLQNDGRVSLAAAPVAGGPSVKLWDGVQSGSADWWFWLTPDSTRAVFVANEPGGRRAYAAPLGGGQAIALSELQRIGPNTGGVGPGLSDGGVGAEVVVLSAVQPGDMALELYAVSLSGGTPVRLSGPRPFVGQLHPWHIAQAAGRVVVAADLEQAGALRLYSVPISGGAPVALSEPFPADTPWISSELTADTMSVVYGMGRPGDRESGPYAALYVARVDGQGGRLLAQGGDIQHFILAPDSQRALIIADHDGDGTRELYVVRLWE